MEPAQYRLELFDPIQPVPPNEGKIRRQEFNRVPQLFHGNVKSVHPSHVPAAADPAVPAPCLPEALFYHKPGQNGIPIFGWAGRPFARRKTEAAQGRRGQSAPEPPAHPVQPDQQRRLNRLAGGSPHGPGEGALAGPQKPERHVQLPDTPRLPRDPANGPLPSAKALVRREPVKDSKGFPKSPAGDTQFVNVFGVCSLEGARQAAADDPGEFHRAGAQFVDHPALTCRQFSARKTGGRRADISVGGLPRDDRADRCILWPYRGRPADAGGLRAAVLFRFRRARG